MRYDLQIIASWIEKGSRVLDLGCGNGDLLAWLAANRAVKGTGIERDKEKAAFCIGRGLSVLQGDLNAEVEDYPDRSFDYVILSQTLQQVFEPANLLKTPEHIAPVWYFTPFYAILRAVPSKGWGAFLMLSAIVLLFFLPWLDRCKVKSVRYRG